MELASPEYVQVYSAKVLAHRAHEGQFYNKYPYTKHLSDVVDVLKRFNASSTLRETAAWLHDIVEDTPICVSAIRSAFGDSVAEVVELLTDKPGNNRKERHEKTYPLLAKNIDAVAVKLADRIANVQTSMSTRNLGKMSMYVKEYDTFKAELQRYHNDYVLQNMWNHLDELHLAGRILGD